MGPKQREIVKKLRVDFPEKLRFLWEHHRYKCAYGGRDSTKSWSFAQALLIQGCERSIRNLCTREYQASIKDSVHKLLSDQIKFLGIEDAYETQDQTIKSRVNDTTFVFSGLSNLTADNLKSYEGIDRAWCEEGQTLTQHSITVLDPTIRKPGSEIWCSLNPRLASDPAYQFFVSNSPPDTIAVKLSWRDNKFFTEAMNNSRLHFKTTQPDDYQNVWEGDCLPAVEGAIYYREIQTAENTRHICRVPYDPMLKAHVVFDLGRGHTMCCAAVQKHLSEIRIPWYWEEAGQDLPYFSNKLRALNYNWGRCYLPHDGYSEDHKLGLSSRSIMKKFGWDVPERKEVQDVFALSVEEGIRTVRMRFPQVYIDDENTQGKTEYGVEFSLLDSLKRYCRVLNRTTMTFGAPAQTSATDGADLFRYVCLFADKMTNDERKTQRQCRVVSYGARDNVVGI